MTKSLGGPQCCLEIILYFPSSYFPTLIGVYFRLHFLSSNLPTLPTSYLLQKRTFTSSHMHPYQHLYHMVSFPVAIRNELFMFLGKSTNPPIQQIHPLHQYKNNHSFRNSPRALLNHMDSLSPLDLFHQCTNMLLFLSS